jgi:serine/threonine protein kinase/Flp pilus assembly protein TadD
MCCYNLGHRAVMNAERWRQVEALYHSAQKWRLGERSAFLAEACGGDEELRREVESLLAQDSSSGILESPAWEAAPSLLSQPENARLPPGTQIGPYKIEGTLGAGGMGEVYRARDTKLKRDVALKVLPEAFARDPERMARFQREAEVLASLNHPNIATIHGLEEFHGSQCLVMELVPGQSLAERVTSGPLPVEEALRICIQIAEALRAAHQKRITHRDIKPANIKIRPDGWVKVLDFGLAKSFIPEDSGSDPSGVPTMTAMTQSGVILGTPSYMSPEQVRGQPTGKPADIWAFGCVLFELLAGRRPFPGSNIAEIIASVLKTEPDWKVLPPGTPAKLRELLQSCLEKDSSRRLQDIGDARTLIDEALRGPTAAREPALDHAVRSLAVLPFANASGDPQMEYLSDGLTESIISTLSQLPQLRVMARSSVFRYKSRSEDAQEIGRALGVRAVLTGKVLQRGETLVISAELADVENGWQLWGAQYKRKVEDIFATEEEIAKEISGNLRLKLTPEKQNALAKRYTENVEAYHLYLKGRFYWGKRTEESLNKGIQYFREAIENDPTYALAYAGLAEGYIPLGFYCHLSPKEAFPKARAAAQRALEIDPERVEALTVIGSVKCFHDWDLEGAEKTQRAAIELNPNYPRARQQLAECLTEKGHFAEATAEVRRALELDPLSLHMNAAVVMDCYFARQFDEAIEHGRAAVEMDTSFYPTRFYLGLAYQQKEQFSEAVSELQQARTLSNTSTLMVASLGGALAACGKEAEARNILHELEELARRKYVSQVFVAAIYAALGDKDRALTRLEKAYADRCSWLPRCLLLDARLDSLRNEARFQRLIHLVNISHQGAQK